MDLQQLTKEQRAELKAQLNAQDEQEKKQRKDDIDAYALFKYYPFNDIGKIKRP